MATTRRDRGGAGLGAQPIRAVLEMLDSHVQDSPVQPELWRQFAQVPLETRLRVVIRLVDWEQPMPIAAILAKHLKRAEILVIGDHITANVNLSEFFSVVIRQSAWQRLADTVREMDLAQIGDLFATLDDRIGLSGIGALPTETAGPAWLVARLASIIGQSENVPLDSVFNRLADWLAKVRADTRIQLVTAADQRTLSAVDAAQPIGAQADPDTEDARSGKADRSPSPGMKGRRRRPVVYVSFDRPVTTAVDISRRTVKVDAVEKTFSVDCRDLLWAVIDTGIASGHAAFRVTDLDESSATSDAASSSRVVATFDINEGLRRTRARGRSAQRYRALAEDEEWNQFYLDARVSSSPGAPAVPPYGDHGTHVAGILAGDLPPRLDAEDADDPGFAEMKLQGMAPSLRLLDIRIFDSTGVASELVVLTAMAFVRWLNRRTKINNQAIDGVNVSISVPFAVDSMACGWTPVCTEADRMVRDGMVVCVAAGNAGYEAGSGAQSLGTGFRMMSITDPGNADSVITVGATHRRDPHQWGPIARSARGPTADGRHKPDLLAPGDRIAGPVPVGPPPGLVDRRRMSGTSQATAHVSGIAALLLGRYPELRGRPAEVKAILCSTSTDLRRQPDFQGSGLVDAFRALQRP